MSARDDELTQRYREASEQEDARPGAHVRAAVRAHAQMLAAAPLPTAPAASSPVAANQSHWKITALATVAVVGLTGLLLLQFQRGTPEEQEIAYGQRRAEAPARAQPSAAAPPAPAPAEAPSASPAVPQGRARDDASSSARSMAQKPAAPARGQAGPLAKTAPAPAIQEAESPTAAGAAGAVSGFPASPPLTADRSSLAGSAPPMVPSAPSAPRGEMRERFAVQDAPAAGAAVPPPPAAAAETARSAAPVQALPVPKAVLRRQDSSAADNSLAAAAPRADSGGSAALPDDLREAARTGHPQQVESLIREGAPVDARDNAGRTALMLAAMNGQTTAVQKLLALGANPALVDREGLGAAQHARRLGYTRIAELIEAAP
jgi:cytoskeletal protein RodZ